MPDNLRHAQYGSEGIQIDSPQALHQSAGIDPIFGKLTINSNIIQNRPQQLTTQGDSHTSAYEQNPLTTFVALGSQTNNRDSNSPLYALHVLLGAGSVNVGQATAISGSQWSQVITTQTENKLGFTSVADLSFMIFAGTNDIYKNASPRTAAQCITDAIIYINFEINRGTNFVTTTVPLRNAILNNTNFGTQTVTAAKIAEHKLFNAWINTLPNLYPGRFIVFDIATDMLDTTFGTDYNARIGTTDDGLHLATGYVFEYAARVMVPVLKNILAYKKLDIYPTTTRDTLALYAGSKQLVDWPLLNGGTAGGTANNTSGVASGVISTGYTLLSVGGGSAATSVGSIVTAPSGIGNAQRVVHTGTADGSGFQITTQPSAARISSSDYFYGCGMLYIENCTNVKEIKQSLKITWTAPSAGDLSAQCGTQHNNIYTDLNTTFPGKANVIPLLTPYQQLPAGLTISAIDLRIYVTFFANGSGTFQYYQAGGYKNKTPY